MKKLLVILLIAMLLVPLGARAEGPGFDSPEAAAAAYIAGLQHNDLREMLDAFAIETYVEHYDVVALAQRLGAYVFTSMPLPPLDDFARQVNVEARRGEIVTAIRWQYASLMIDPDQADALYDTAPIKDVDANDFLRDYYARADENLPLNIAFDGDFVDGFAWAAFPEYYAFSAQRGLYRSTAWLNADQVEEVVAFLKIDGRDYVLLMQTLRYGERWYAGRLGGMLAMCLGPDVDKVGLVPVESLGMDDATFEALWQRCRDDEELMAMTAEHDALLEGIDFMTVDSPEDVDAATVERLDALAEQIQARIAQ